MPQRLHSRLKQRGWDAHDIRKTVAILESEKTRAHHRVHRLTILVSILVIIVGNVLVSLALIPLLFGLKNSALYPSLIVLGLCMGLLFEILTRSMPSLEHEHHVLLIMLVPFLALLAVIFTAVYANDAAYGLGLHTAHNPYIVAVLYALAFLAPYLYFKFFLKKHYYSG